MIIKRRGAAALASVALLTVAMSTVPAHADPSFTPDSNDLVGVGSDTTEFVVGALANKFNADGVGGTVRMASWNATGSATITPRSGADAITRPNGSSSGIDELQANEDISFARSSRGPNTSGDEGTIFFPFAKDKLGYVYSKPGSHAARNLSANKLKQIYTCQKTNWSQFNQPRGKIKAKVPQAGSGTRSFFLASIGITEDQLQDAIAQPNSVCNVSEVQEHDPAAVVGNKNAIAPFSFARFKTLPRSTKQHIAFAGSAPFVVTRNVYNVIRSADAGDLGGYFDDESWICTDDDAKTVIASKGFTRLPSGQCGVPVIA